MNKVGELIAALQKVAAEKGADCKVELAVVSYDRYGDTVGLIADGNKEAPLMSEYFGGEMPRW